MNQLIKFHLAILTSTLLLSACTTSKDVMIPKPSQNMRAVYDAHTGSLSTGKIKETRMVLRRPIEENDFDLAQYSRTESNQLKKKFTFLPNPELIMYVAPHLSTSSNIPVPGYITQFRMYEKDHYALPHEMVNYSKQQAPPVQE